MTNKNNIARSNTYLILIGENSLYIHRKQNQIIKSKLNKAKNVHKYRTTIQSHSTWNKQQEDMGPMPEASGSGMADEEDYSTFENKTGLAEDMKFLASMPELCDVTFLVGDTREPVCAVKAVLAARSRCV